MSARTHMNHIYDVLTVLKLLCRLNIKMDKLSGCMLLSQRRAFWAVGGSILKYAKNS